MVVQDGKNEELKEYIHKLKTEFFLLENNAIIESFSNEDFNEDDSEEENYLNYLYQLQTD